MLKIKGRRNSLNVQKVGPKPLTLASWPSALVFKVYQLDMLLQVLLPYIPKEILTAASAKIVNQHH